MMEEKNLVLEPEQEKEMAEAIKEQLPEQEGITNESEARTVIENYINDKDVQNNALYWAKQFEDRFRGNWFTLEKVMKKTIFKNIGEAQGVLQIMALAGYCHVTTENKKLKYKITLDFNDKVRLLEYDQKRLEEEYDQTLLNLEAEYGFKKKAIETEIERLKLKAEEKPKEEVKAETEGSEVQEG